MLEQVPFPKLVEWYKLNSTGKKEEDEECGDEKYREKAGEQIQNTLNEVLKELIKVLFKINFASFKIVWTFVCLFIEDRGSGYIYISKTNLNKENA